MFKEFIDNQILNYPTLYMKDTYQKSEAMVLDQVFFVIGNGFEWLNGYPLCPSGWHNLKDYKPVDIDYFFKMKDKIYMLDIDGKKTKDYIQDIKIPIMKEYSNERYLYTMDTKFVKDYNRMVREDYPEPWKFDIFDRVERFEKVTQNFWFDMISFYPIYESYSMITEITKQEKSIPEVIQYGLKMLDYAERQYTGGFGQKSLEHAKKNHIVPEEELKKIYKLRKELNERI